MTVGKRLTPRLFKALLRVGEINAVELDRTFDGLPARERPPGLLAAYAEVKAAERARDRWQPLDSGDPRHLRSSLWNHARYCRKRVAHEGALPIACEHGFDACPTCDPCTCANPPRGRIIARRARSTEKKRGSKP